MIHEGADMNQNNIGIDLRFMDWVDDHGLLGNIVCGFVAAIFLFIVLLPMVIILQPLFYP